MLGGEKIQNPDKLDTGCLILDIGCLSSEYKQLYLDIKYNWLYSELLFLDIKLKKYAKGKLSTYK